MSGRSMTTGAIAFALPATPLVKVSYMRDGVKYEAVMTNPRSNERLKEIMLKRNVGLSQIRFVAAMGKAVR